MAWAFAACLAPENDAGRHQQGHDPLDSLLGYYSGVIERTLCKESAALSCARFETDTLPAANLSLTRQGDSLTFFLQTGTFLVLPGDTVFADSADTVGRVRCVRFPQQVPQGWGSAWRVTHVGDSTLAEGSTATLCLSPADDALPPFTLASATDTQLFASSRLRFFLSRSTVP